MNTPARLIVEARGERSAIEALAQRSGWTLVADQPRTHTTFRMLTWQQGEAPALSWIEDHGFGVRVVVCAQSVADAVRSALPTVARERCLADAGAEDPIALLRGLRALVRLDGDALADDTRDALDRASRHPLVAVRGAVWRLLGLASSAATLSTIDRAASEEPDPRLRELFAQLATSIRGA